jgi:hypothetical protein
MESESMGRSAFDAVCVWTTVGLVVEDVRAPAGLRLR